jgi:hypothetical protein
VVLSAWWVLEPVAAASSEPLPWQFVCVFAPSLVPLDHLVSISLSAWYLGCTEVVEVAAEVANPRWPHSALPRHASRIQNSFNPTLTPVRSRAAHFWR